MVRRVASSVAEPFRWDREFEFRSLQRRVTSQKWRTAPLEVLGSSPGPGVHLYERRAVRIRIPPQTQPTFLGEECYLRIGSSTKKATGPQIAAASKLFSQK